MTGWMIFGLIVIGMLVSYKIIEQITYTICWLKSDNETKEKLLKSQRRTNNTSE